MAIVVVLILNSNINSKKQFQKNISSKTSDLFKKIEVLGKNLNKNPDAVELNRKLRNSQCNHTICKIRNPNI